MACGIGLKKLHMHNWGVVNSFMWYITTLSGFSGMRGEERAASPLADLWLLEWFVAYVDGCIDTARFTIFIRAFQCRFNFKNSKMTTLGTTR